MKPNIFVACLIAAGLVGCASAGASRRSLPALQMIDIPKIGQICSAEVGETTVQRAKLSTYKAINLKNQVTGGDGVIIKKFTIPPGILSSEKENDRFEIFTTDKAMVYDALLGTMPAVAGLAIGKTTPAVAHVYAFGKLLKPSEPPQFSFTTVDAIDQPGFKKEFIYTGRAGDSLRFLYREFSGDLIRPAFSQELQYDLKDGSVIGFKGLRMEILRASNTLVEYRLLNSFAD